MALPDYKINAFSKPVSALGDTPQMSAAELKEWFDSNSTNELKNSVNGIIDETVAELSGKVDKTEGKDLSTNDYTNEEKQKVALAVTQDELEGAIADLINGAPEALDTLKELGDALALHEDAYDALLEMVGNKANKTELDAYATKKEIENGTIQTRHSQTADLAYYADYADGAGQAQSAINDTMGNDIISTYATKEEFNAKIPDVPDEVLTYILHSDGWHENIDTRVGYADVAGRATVAETDFDGNLFSDYYATKEELPKRKTLIDTTLTEEQGGVSEILLAIEDVEAFLNARQIRFAMSFPVAEAKAANAFITSVSIADSNHTSYNIIFLRGNNRVSSGDARFYTTASLDVLDFEYDSYLTKSFFSLMSLPTPNYSTPANNITSATTHCIGGFPINAMRERNPYLRITISNVTLEKGTHIFMEVCE